MAQFGKASAKRSKPSYFMAILGVTIVLFFIGIFGWLFINAQGYSEKLKEDVKVQVYLKKTFTESELESFQNYLNTQPYTKSSEYVDPAQAKDRWLKSGEDDFADLLDENPLPASVEFNLRGDFVNKDTIANIKNELMNQFSIIESVSYPSLVVEKIGSNLAIGLLVFAVLAGIFCLFSIILIDNTIKLAMYSNRFIIKTMQTVGATRGFIAKPMIGRAVINGTISAIIASALIYGLVWASEYFLPYLSDLRDMPKLLLLFALLLTIGIIISLISTWVSVRKYLRMSLDDLY